MSIIAQGLEIILLDGPLSASFLLLVLFSLHDIQSNIPHHQSLQVLGHVFSIVDTDTSVCNEYRDSGKVDDGQAVFEREGFLLDCI